MVNNYIHSPLNYVGGKHRLLPTLVPLFPRNVGTFVDMFCGGCNVGINVNAKRVVFNDISQQLIDLYRTFKDRTLQEILCHVDRQVSDYSLSKTNKDGYLRFRDYYNSTRNPLDLFVLICHSFNNQVRFNSKGEFNMPFGLDRSSFNSRMRDNLASFVVRLHEIDSDFRCGSFSDFDTSSLTSEDYVYCDPPYLITEAVYNTGYTEETECELLSFLDELDLRGVRFGLSNVLSSSGKENKILKDWLDDRGYHVERLSMNYGNCNYQKKDKSFSSEEVFICNYEPEFFLI